jgi:glycosyltransferase involved in cell wall biosynthesis
VKLSIIIPVYNEIFTIAEILRRVRAVPLEKEIIVVDDCSTDGSRRFLERLDDPNIKVVLQPRNGGKGAAVRAAVQHITGDVVVVQDADLEYDPQELPRLMGFIERNEADAVYGSRFLGTRRSFMFTHYVGNVALNLLTNILFNTCLTDMETCYKLLKAPIFKTLDLKSNGFDIEPEITAKIILSGHRIVEAPITYVGRDYAEGKKIRWTDGFAAIGALLYWRLFGPERVEDTLDRLESADVYNAWVASWFAADVGQKVLEVGAGLGTVARYFVNRQALHLVDIDDRYVANLKRKFQYVEHVKVIQQDFAAPDAVKALAGIELDTVVMSNVLEHFEDDEHVLRQCHSVLPPGGNLVLILPAHQSLFGTLDVSVGHFRRYDHETLTPRLEKLGFEVTRHQYHNWLGALGWYFTGRIVKSKRISRFSIGGFQFVMPLARALDRWIPLSFGQSVVVIARKRAAA